MESRFTAEFFKGNREKLRKLFTGTAPIVLSANGLLQRAADSSFTFKQDSSFWYLTGIDEPDVVLVMDKYREYLIIPEQSDYQRSFDGTVADQAHARISGIETVLGYKEGWRALNTRSKKVKHIATLAAAPAYLEMYGMYTNPARQQLAAKLQRANTSLKLLDIRPHLAQMRVVKQPSELAAMKTAIKLTIEAIRLVSKKLPKLGFEYEVDAEITRHFLRHGAQNCWKPIVAAGGNATILHYIANHSAIAAREMVLIDIGAEYDHYASDISRTFLPRNPTKRQLQVIEAVKEVQDFAFNLVKPGALIKENERLVEHFMGEKLRELGLIKTINRETVRHYFPHATSHFLGLDAHDVGDYTKPLAVGTVLTVEPGIYIPEENIGVRIEDDLLVTKNGYQNLSKSLER